MNTAIVIRGAAEFPDFRYGIGLAEIVRMSTPQRQDLKARAFAFAERILKIYKRLAAGGPAHAHMAQQLFEAGTSIGAQLEEAEVANSRRDMASKHAIALRESRESNYWLRLFSTEPEWRTDLAPLVQESLEFVRMLTVSVRKLRAPLANPGQPARITAIARSLLSRTD